MIEMFYNGENPFEGISSVPLVSRQEQPIVYGERWGTQRSLTLNGMLTGISGDFESLISAQRQLAESFSKSFQDFVILDDGNVVYSGENCIVRDINFGQSKYVNFVPYTITLEHFPREQFSGTFGVINPTNEVSYEEGRDGFITISHKISAKGFNTDKNKSNALENAISYVKNLSGDATPVLPLFINVCTGIRPVLRNIAENTDRFGATYSITNTYIADPRNTGEEGIFRHSTEVDTDNIGGLVAVSLKGEIEGGKYQSLSSLRRKFSQVDVFSLVNEAYYDSTARTDLNPNYLSSGVEEDYQSRKLSFSVAFNNDSSPMTYFDYQVSTNTDSLTEVSSVSFNGTIRSRGDLKSRYARVLAFYENLNVLGYVSSAYNALNIGVPLNPVPISSGVTYNEFAGEIAVSLSFNNRDIPPVAGVEKFEFNVAVNPPVEKIVSKPLLYETENNKSYVVFDFGFARRGTVSVNGNALVSRGVSMSTVLPLIKQYVFSVGSRYGTATRRVLEAQNFKTDNASHSRSVSFSCSWSFEDEAFTV